MSVLDYLRHCAADPAERGRVFLLFEDERFTFAEVLAESARYAHLFLRHRRPGRPFHVGLLLAPSVEDPPRVERVWSASDRNAGEARSYAPLADEVAAESAEDPRIDVADSDLFLMLFTSGTTQAPKGVMHERLLARFRAAGAEARLQLGALP